MASGKIKTKKFAKLPKNGVFAQVYLSFKNFEEGKYQNGVYKDRKIPGNWEGTWNFQKDFCVYGNKKGRNYKEHQNVCKSPKDYGNTHVNGISKAQIINYKGLWDKQDANWNNGCNQKAKGGS